MGRTKNTTTHEITDGLYLKASASGVWHYYFALNGIQFRKSTKVKDKAKAIKVAIDAQEDAAHRRRSGFVTKKVSFKDLIKKHLESLHGEPATKIKFHKDQIDRYLAKFFNKFDDISKIDNGTLNDYLIWRKAQSTPCVKNSTLNREKPVLNQMLRLAADYKWLEKGIQLKHQSEAQSRHRRAHFTKDELYGLLKKGQERIKECIDPNLSEKERGLLTNRYWKRLLLQDVIVVLTATGMRVDEMKTVTWNDINFEASKIKLKNAGKTKSSRTVFVHDVGVDRLKRMKARRIAYTKKHGIVFDKNEPIQSMVNGRFIRSLRKGFDALLEASGFIYKDISEKHSLTSLRHSYATRKLTLKERSVSIKALSKQMGTSSLMIDRHYGHDVTEDYEFQILGKTN